MSALKPGLYRATVRGVPDVTVMVVGDGCGYMTEEVNGGLAHLLKDITDARPLIVLDLKDLDVHKVVAALRRVGWERIAVQIEAQSKPVLMDEPEVWGVVESATEYYTERTVYVHDDETGLNHWRSRNGTCTWDDLIDPREIREGLS